MNVAITSFEKVLKIDLDSVSEKDCPGWEGSDASFLALLRVPGECRLSREGRLQPITLSAVRMMRSLTD